MNVQSSPDTLWQKRLDALAEAWPSFQRGDVEALHKVRVASRRLREALPVVAGDARPSKVKKKVKKLTKRLREVTRTLGPIRELDVELAMIEANAAMTPSYRRALALLRREVALRRRELRRELARHGPVDLDKLVKKSKRVLGRGARAARDRDSWRAALATLIMRRTKRLKARLEQAGPLFVAEPIHDARVAIKKLRYALEIAQEAGIAEAGAQVKILKRHQDRLGRLQDLQMALRRVREIASTAEGETPLGELTAYAKSLEQECRRLHADFVGNRDELFGLIADVRQRIVPAVTTPRLKAARATGARARSDGRAGAR
jgi:CHAD domain-containing protein